MEDPGVRSSKIYQLYTDYLAVTMCQMIGGKNRDLYHIVFKALKSITEYGHSKTRGIGRHPINNPLKGIDQREKRWVELESGINRKVSLQAIHAVIFKKSGRSHSVRGLKLLSEPSFCHLKAIIVSK